MFHRRWTLLLLQGGPRLRVSDKGPRHYELPAEPTCRPASGRHIADLASRWRRVDRLCAGCRVTCLHPDPVRRTYPTGRGTPQNRRCRSPVYESPSRRSDLAPHQRRIRTGSDFFLLFFISFVLSFSSSISSDPVHDPHQAMPFLSLHLNFVDDVRSRSLFWSWVFNVYTCRVVAYSPPLHVFSSYSSRRCSN